MFQIYQRRHVLDCKPIDTVMDLNVKFVGPIDTEDWLVSYTILQSHDQISYLFVRQKIQSSCTTTSFVNSNDQSANILTKSLRGSRIEYICNKLGAHDMYAPA